MINILSLILFILVALCYSSDGAADENKSFESVGTVAPYKKIVVADTDKGFEGVTISAFLDVCEFTKINKRDNKFPVDTALSGCVEAGKMKREKRSDCGNETPV